MERLKILRETKGLSQAQLAVMADMNPTTLWRYETGQRSPTVEQLERLAEVLEVEVNDFFPKARAPLPLDPMMTEAERIEELRGFARLIIGVTEQWTQEIKENLATGAGPFGWGLEKQWAAVGLVGMIRDIPSIGDRDEAEPDLSPEEQQAKQELSQAVEELFAAATRAGEIERRLEENSEEIPESMITAQRHHLTALRGIA